MATDPMCKRCTKSCKQRFEVIRCPAFTPQEGRKVGRPKGKANKAVYVPIVSLIG